MSTIVCVKEKDVLVLGTDSRFLTRDFGAVYSDAEQKIHEIAPKTFIATSGWKLVCEFQETRARELSAEMGTNDIRVISAALLRESIPRVKELAEILSGMQNLHEDIGRAVSGAGMIHNCLLAGRTADKKLGYVKHAYRMISGNVVIEPEEYFGDDRRIFVSAGDPARHLAQEEWIWTLAPVPAVQGIMAELKRVCPKIGGPDQIVSLNHAGARWVSRPPVKEKVV